ncbi:MAG TPA: N-acetylmuramoyl-L-alanine amidase [Gammaproteobacteria bacterium]
MSSQFRPRCLAALTLAFVASTAQTAQVEGLRVWSGPESTRVVLDLSAETPHRVFSLQSPHRFVIDLSNAQVALPAAIPTPRGVVAGVRTGARPGGDLRVVLDLTVAVRANTFLLEPNDTYGHRLVVDLSPVETEPVVTRTPPQTAPGGRPLIIAIDAGHGGDDPGATGPNGVREKQVVLEIARQLAAEVERQPGMRPLLIREGDYFVSHRERMNRAHRAEADLFVSIHADAFRTGAARGATVYMLSSKGASDEAAHRLAERENASDLLGGVSLSDKDDLLAGVLLDLSQSAAISASSIAGSYVIDQLRRVTRVRKSDVQQAPFLVLKSPDIPSLLIETAYISNPEEERALNDSRFRAALARAIHDGIVDYFRANPPPGSYVAYNPPPVRQQPVRHVISRGETLSGIAERYRVRLAALKTYNEISTDVIQVGQVLTIPL